MVCVYRTVCRLECVCKQYQSWPPTVVPHMMVHCMIHTTCVCGLMISHDAMGPMVTKSFGASVDEATEWWCIVSFSWSLPPHPSIYLKKKVFPLFFPQQKVAERVTPIICINHKSLYFALKGLLKS